MFDRQQLVSVVWRRNGRPFYSHATTLARQVDVERTSAKGSEAANVTTPYHGPGRN